MPDTVTLRENRLRMTKAQLIDEIDTLEQRAAAIEAAYRSGAPVQAMTGDAALAHQELAHLARFPSENPNPVFRVMPDGYVLYANDAALAVTGLLTGRKKSKLTPELAPLCAKVSRGGELAEHEFHSDNRVIALSITPVVNEPYVNIYGRDVTKRKHAEEALRASQELLTTVVDYMPAYVYLRDLEGRFLLVNKRYEEIHGVSKDELLGRTLHEVFPKAAADDYAALDPKVAKHRKEFESEVTVRFADGDHVLAVAQFPVFDRDGNVTAVGGVDTDITERKRDEAALREGEARLRAIVDNAPAEIYLTDTEGRYVLINREFERRYGVTEAAVRGKTVHDLFPAAAADQYHAQDRGALENLTQVVVEQDVVYLGETHTDLEAKFPVVDSNGRVLGIGGVATDITERKQAEEELRRARAEAVEANRTAQLLQKIAVAANEASVPEDAVKTCLDEICAFTGWPIGHVCTLAGDGTGELVTSDIWHHIHPRRFKEFRKVSEGAQFAPGKGLPGRVLASGEPEWIVDVTKDRRYRRSKIARAVGIRAGFAFPVLVGRNVVAVLEFYAEQPAEPDPSVMEVMAHVGAQIGRVVERKRAEEALRASVVKREEGEQFLRTVVDTIPAHISIRDTEGRCVLVNRRLADDYGIEPSDALGKFPRDVFPPSSIDEVEEKEFRQIVATGIGTVDVEYAYGDEGDLRYRLSTRQPIKDGDGRLLCVLTVSHDITERKQTEQALKEGEALFNAGARIATLGHWAWDEVEDRCVYCSEEHARIHGVTVDEYLAASTSLESESNFVHPDDRQEYVNITDWQEPGETYDFEYRIVRPDGETRHVRELGEKIFDDMGRHVRTVGTQQDITDQKEAEAEFVGANAALKESEERYALAMMGSNEGLWDWDLRTNEIYISPNIADLLGIDAGTQMIGPDQWDAAIHPDDIERYDAATQAHHRGETEFYTCEYRLLGRDGQYRWVQDRGLGQRNADGTIYRMAGSLGDITERKVAEEALRQDQALFDHAARLASLGHWAYDEVADMVIYASDEVARIHGVSVEEHLAHLSSTDKDIERAHPDDQEMLGRVLREAQRDATTYDVEYRVVRPDGDVRYVRELGEPVLDDSGKLIRSFGTLQDITERKQAEAALRESQGLLSAVIDAVPAMINAKDAASRYIFVNRYQAELYGVDPDDAIGKTAGQLLGRKYGAHTRRLDRDVIASGETLHNFEEDHVDAHGVRRRLLATKVPLKGPEDEVRGVVTVALDISDRKRAEQALRESETRFVQAARLADLGHWAWDEVDDRCTYCSEQLAHIHGVMVDDYLASTRDKESDLARIHPGDRDTYNRITREWHGNDEDTYDIEYRIIRPDGEVRHVREIAECIRDGKGRRVQSIGTKQDITAAKEAEAELLVAQQRTEAANNLVLEKNTMLESLSSKLSKYLSPQIYASIFSGEQSAEITSQRKKMTVFFSDIADFTESTDQLESEELTSLLNQYLTEMSKIALAFGATIDKFVGDAIMLFLGDPSTKGVKEDAVACVRMAIAMQRRMRELQIEWRDRGMEHPFQLRIGINTGYCTVGNFGSEDRMDYTIVGNEVNLAARLQTHAELGGILVANETYSLVKGVIQAEEQSPITVKGIYDDLIAEGRIIRAEQDGLRLTIDLEKHNKADAIKAIEAVLAKLKK